MNLPHFNPDWSETTWDQSLNARLDALEFDLLITTPMTAHANLAFDEVLLYRVADARRKPVFRLWDWTEKAVILGSYQSVQNEIDAETASKHVFTFARRISGGGAMIVEPRKTITYSLIVPELVVEGLSFRQSFAFLDRWCIQALRSLGIPASYRPINDIISPEGKIAGAAQCRRKKTVLHHTTMAFELDNTLMERLLRHNKNRTGRGIVSAEKVVSPLSRYTSASIDELRMHLVESFSSLFRTCVSRPTEEEIQETEKLVHEKYSLHDWLYRVE